MTHSQTLNEVVAIVKNWKKIALIDTNINIHVQTSDIKNLHESNSPGQLLWRGHHLPHPHCQCPTWHQQLPILFVNLIPYHQFSSLTCPLSHAAAAPPLVPAPLYDVQWQSLMVVCRETLPISTDKICTITTHHDIPSNNHDSLS